jgi:hypothetical protein
MDPLHRQAIVQGVLGTLFFVVLIFWPAGTFDYWQDLRTRDANERSERACRGVRGAKPLEEKKRRLPDAAFGLDQPKRLAAHEDLRVIHLAPAERRHVPILAQGSAAVSLLEACP